MSGLLKQTSAMADPSGFNQESRFPDRGRHLGEGGRSLIVRPSSAPRSAAPVLLVTFTSRQTSYTAPRSLGEAEKPTFAYPTV